MVELVYKFDERKFEKVNQLLKYDSNYFFGPQTYIDIYTVWTPTPITLPRLCCACGVTIKKNFMFLAN